MPRFNNAELENLENRIRSLERKIDKLIRDLENYVPDTTADVAPEDSGTVSDV